MMRLHHLSVGLAAVCAALSVVGAAHAQYTVPGSSDPWLAGMPNGSTATLNDSAPGQSPVQVNCTVSGGGIFTFAVSGEVSNTPSLQGLTPDGGGFQSLSYGPTNNIADVNAPINSLIGVFLDNSQPDSSAQPGGLDFSSIGLNFTSLSPGLKQPFFIGDGLTGTGSGSVQQFIAPAGATRLFLGTMDGYEWNNNSGAFAVDVTCSDLAAVPEPGAIVTSAFLFGGLGLGLLRARRK